MMSALSSRREFSLRVASACSVLGLAGLPFLISSASAFAAETEEISRNSEAIHQEVEFKAPPDRIYKALTDPAQFGKITEFSMPGETAHISGQVGAHSLCSAATSREDTSNLCQIGALCRRGAMTVGRRASIPSPGSRFMLPVPEPGSSSTTLVSHKVAQPTWQRVGRAITGSR